MCVVVVCVRVCACVCVRVCECMYVCSVCGPVEVLDPLLNVTLSHPHIA